MEVHCVRYCHNVVRNWFEKSGRGLLVGGGGGVEYITRSLPKRPLLCMFLGTSPGDLSLEKRDDV